MPAASITTSYSPVGVPAPEPLGGRPLVGVAGLDVGVVALVERGGRGQQSDGAAADDRDALAGGDLGSSDPVPGDAGGLHQAGVLDGQAGGQRYQPVVRHQRPGRPGRRRG